MEDNMENIDEQDNWVEDILGEEPEPQQESEEKPEVDDPSTLKNLSTEDDLKEEREREEKTGSITGNKLLDIHLKYNYTSGEIEFLKHLKGDWKSKIENKEVNEFFKHQRLKKITS